MKSVRVCCRISEICIVSTFRLFFLSFFLVLKLRNFATQQTVVFKNKTQNSVRSVLGNGLGIKILGTT